MLILDIFLYNEYVNQFFFIMNLSKFTEFELETITNAMEDYINYDDESLSNDELIGGLSVEDRVTSINNKIYSFFTSKEVN